MLFLLLYNFNTSCKFPEPNTYFDKHFFLASSSTHPCNFLGNSMEMVWHCFFCDSISNFHTCLKALGFPGCHPFKFQPAFLRPNLGQLSTATCRRFSEERQKYININIYVNIYLIKDLTYFVTE